MNRLDRISFRILAVAYVGPGLLRRRDLSTLDADQRPYCRGHYRKAARQLLQLALPAGLSARLVLDNALGSNDHKEHYRRGARCRRRHHADRAGAGHFDHFDRADTDGYSRKAAARGASDPAADRVRCGEQASGKIRQGPVPY